MPTSKPKRILIAPLDWGLGHTTRCIPIIKHIKQSGHIPVFAGNQNQAAYIRQGLAETETVLLDGYNIAYSQINRFAQAGLLLQTPGMLRAIGRETAWLGRQAGELRIDGVISDNRYGLHHPGIPSVILTHQLMVRSGLGPLADGLVRRLHYRWLDRFNEVWVVDQALSPGLAGALSHPATLPARTTYLGLLSAYGDTSPANEHNGLLLMLLSGPEPQRSEIAQILWRQALMHSGKVVFVEGSASARAPVGIPGHIQYHSILGGDALKDVLSRAGMVVCRSGYSTLMDLVFLGKKAILIPTPGQTEQAYLGRLMHQRGIFFCATQRNLNLRQALLSASESPFSEFAVSPVTHTFQQTLDRWIESL